jgi:prepilin-type N-terminal cleavage/methylation domain-containing protein
MKSFNPQQHGFSLVETLVAITILLVVIVGPMSISSQTARSTSFASEQVIAFFLAQEGAEIAQKARDDLLLASFLPTTDGNYNATPWADFSNDTATGFFDDCFDAPGCGLELNNDGTMRTPLECDDSTDECRLYFRRVINPSNRAKYTHVPTSASSTPFYRVINMTQVDDREIEVTSRVFWRTGNQRAAQEVVVQTYLFNVYGN